MALLFNEPLVSGTRGENSVTDNECIKTWRTQKRIVQKSPLNLLAGENWGVTCARKWWLARCCGAGRSFTSAKAKSTGPLCQIVITQPPTAHYASVLCYFRNELVENRFYPDGTERTLQPNTAVSASTQKDGNFIVGQWIMFLAHEWFNNKCWTFENKNWWNLVDYHLLRLYFVIKNVKAFNIKMQG